MKDKHAYLIMAHTNPKQTALLLRLLDDERNDIYLHYDKNSPKVAGDFWKSAVKSARLYIVPAIKVVWGGCSMIQCEINMLKVATENGEYGRYHLISGQDLPIKTQDEIHSFFSEYKDKEFVRFMKDEFIDQFRVRYYHHFINVIGRKKTIMARILRRAEQASLKMQQKRGVDRTKGRDIKYQKGANWFSITDELARYVVSQEKTVMRMYRKTRCCDEVFLQTLIFNAPRFREKLYRQEFDNDIRAIQRLIDWQRGTPYTFRSEDFEELCVSEMLFARKFDERVDKEIINRIAKRLGQPDEVLL